MTQQQPLQRLLQAMDEAGLDLYALARRAEVSVERVSAAVVDPAHCDVELLVTLAAALGLEVLLEPATPAVRQSGPVPSLVDFAVARIRVQGGQKGGGEDF